MILFDARTPAALCADPNESGAVRLAIADLLRDIEKVSGISGHSLRPLTEIRENSVVIGTLGNAALEETLQKNGVDAKEIAGRWENYLIQEKDGVLYLIGSDERGAMWAIYECSRSLLGVDPMYLFTDHQPARRDSVAVDGLRVVDGPSDYRFRGWFINDEDLIEGCCRQGVPEKGYDFHRDYAPMLARIVESALRMKQNLLIPASHIDMDDPAQEALVKLVTDRGLFISMHHQEPVGVHQVRLDRWFAARGDATENINYVDHPEKYHEIWRHYIRKWAKYPHVIWQLGLRGRGDRPVWYQNDRVPDTVEARGALISRALQEQWDIIAEETGSDDFLSSTTLWMEGMPLYRAGALKFPKGTMVILSDFGPDQMFGEEYYDTPRLPGIEYGLYYHVCFWGCGPHLVQGARPEKALYNYRQAESFGDTAYSVLNVSNIREHVLGIDGVAQATWKLEGLTEEGILRAWCEKEYEAPDGTDIAALYKAYYDCFAHLDDSRLPGRMLLMDGMCKRVALMLMKIIAGEELQRVDIQNKRLFDFESTDGFIDFYSRETAAGAERFASALEKAKACLPQIPENRQLFFRSNLILHIETMLGMYTWVNALCLAAKNRREQGEDAAFKKAVTDAFQALERIAQAREISTGAGWEHWWQGDTLINLPGITETTKALLHGQSAAGDILGARF